MPDILEIHLSRDLNFITVEQAARLIAEAIYPVELGRADIAVAYLIKTTASDPLGSRLTALDVNLLSRIWHSLPPFRDGMPAQEWQAYAQSLHASTDSLDFSIEPVWANRVDSGEDFRLAEEEQHEIYLKRTIRNGALKTYMASMRPCTPADSSAPSARILIGDFMRYLKSNVPAVSIRFHDSATTPTLDTSPRHGPASAGTQKKDRTSEKTRQFAWQEDQIARTIRSLGHDPLKLPPENDRRNVDVKHVVRERCGQNHRDTMRAAIFDKAWERMLAGGSLKRADQR